MKKKFQGKYIFCCKLLDTSGIWRSCLASTLYSCWCKMEELRSTTCDTKRELEPETGNVYKIKAQNQPASWVSEKDQVWEIMVFCATLVLRQTCWWVEAWHFNLLVSYPLEGLRCCSSDDLENSVSYHSWTKHDGKFNLLKDNFFKVFADQKLNIKTNKFKFKKLGPVSQRFLYLKI